MVDRKLSSYDEMEYDNSTKVLIPALKYSSNDPNASIENRNIPLELFYKQPLFKYDWYEYLLDDPNWIRCDTFSWHSGDSQEANSYEKVYQHLVDDISGKTLQSETISGITIQYYLADDKHKICPSTEEQNLIDLYNTTGIAWYYLIDGENIRFKLPRTKWGFTGLRDEVGKYIEQQIKIPNHYHVFSTMGNNAGTFVATNSSITIDRADTTDIGVGNRGWNGNGGSGGFSSNTGVFSGVLITSVAKEAKSKNGYEYGVYGNSTLVQPPATQMYLYCYVGGFTQTSLENIAGQNMNIVNQKADNDLRNITSDAFKNALIASGIIYLKTAYRNGSSGYNIYSNGYCEQWGTTMSQSANITFFKTYNGVPVMTWGFVTQRSSGSHDGEIFYRALSQSGFTSGSRLSNAISPGFMWKATGYLPDGTY